MRQGSSIANAHVEDKTTVRANKRRDMDNAIINGCKRAVLQYSVSMTSKRFLLLAVAALRLSAQQTPFLDPRLGVSTLVREDLFAGFLTNDMARLATGEKTLEALLRERPQAKAEIFAWQGGVELHRAVWAHEKKQAAEFDQSYKKALDLFSQALAADPQSIGVAAITGGSYSLTMDRLPEKHRASAAAKAYEAYHFLLDKQGAGLQKMPIHHRGEVLAGLAQAAQRTGRAAETTQHLDRIIELLPNTPYEARARKWKENPKLAGSTTIACMTCHDAGKLEARRAVLNSAPPTRLQ
jgi:tetratricopeptide (TPR) repeat protein